MHAGTTLTGLVLGLAQGAALCSRLYAGRFADRLGRRLCMQVGLALCGLAGVFYFPWAHTPGLTLARLLHGLGEGFLLTAAVAMVVDLAPPDRRAQSLGWLASGVWGGLSVGPLVGSALGSMTGVATLLVAISFPVALALRWAPDSLTARAHGPQVLLPRAAVLPGIILGLANVPYAAMSAFLALYLRERHVEGAYAFAAFAACVFGGRVVFGSLPDRQGPRKTLFGGLALLASGLVTIALWPGLAVPAAALTGLGYSFPWPSLAVMVAGRVPETQRATALGALTAFFDLFVAVSSPLLGMLAAKFGLAAVFWASALSVGASALVAWQNGIGADTPIGAPKAAECLEEPC